MIMAARTTLILVLLTMTVGCYESADVTNFEPGVYKGESDPLLSANTGERAETLQERFKTVQTDR